MINKITWLFSISLIVCSVGCSPTAKKDDQPSPDKSQLASNQTTTDNSPTPVGDDNKTSNATQSTTVRPPDTSLAGNKPTKAVTTDPSTNDSEANPNSPTERGDGDDVNAEPVTVAETKAKTADEEPILDNGRDGATRPGGPPPTNVNSTNPLVNSSNPLRTTSNASQALPKEFQSLDKDNDGQLGVYEWPRDKLADFSKLDKNGDGFLTGSELGGEKNDANDSKPKSEESEKASESGPDLEAPKTETKLQP